MASRVSHVVYCMARKAGISLRTIADATGVSLVTVSRALNRDFLVDPETAKRVQLAADKLGYKLPTRERRSTRVSNRNTEGKPLRLGRLAFILPDIAATGLDTPLTQGLRKGMTDYLFEKKIDVISSHMNPDGSLPEVLAQKEVDGYVLRGNFEDLPLAKHQMAQMGRFPHVSVFGLPPIDQPELTMPIEDYILPDDRLIGRIALNALAKQHIEKPLLISTLPDQGLPLAQVSTFSRRNGFINESYTQNVSYRKIEIASLNQEAISRQLKKHIDKFGKPEGIFLTRAFPKMLDALNQLGMTTKQNVQLYTAVSGENDSTLSYGVHAINIRPDALGKAAAELLLWRINNPELEAKSILIRPKLIQA